MQHTRIVKYNSHQVQALTGKYMVRVFEIHGTREYPHSGVKEHTGYEALFLFDSDFQARDFIEYLESEAESIGKIYKELEADKYHTYCDIVCKQVPLQERR